MKLLLTFTLILSFTTTAISTTTPDYEKEARWADQIEDSIMVGDPIWIPVNSHKFLSILTLSDTPTAKTAVIVHGLGVHPNWDAVVKPLRVGLTEHNLNTLSIQMPVLSIGEKAQYLEMSDYSNSRLLATEKFLEENNLSPDTLIAHSIGASMSSNYLANSKSTKFKNFVAIGMSEDTSADLSKIKLPILDLFGSDDHEGVKDLNNLKKNATLNSVSYSQAVVDGANHFFDNQNEILVDVVGGWIISR